ncbi:MAG TPA: DegV family protein [Candidatus Cryosericum sp.]|nr:DegV family protein [Candidatus Cryosericum sp.]
MAIHIVTDSISCLPAGYAEEHGIKVVPIRVSVDGVSYREGLEMSSDTFYEKQRAGAKVSTTQASPEEFRAVYEELLTVPGDQVLSIHVSSAMSGTLNSAYSAAEQTDPTRVRIYDSRMAALGLGFMVMHAAALASRGATVEDLVAALDAMLPRIHIYFLVGSLKYLIEGGRIGKAAGVAASVLQIRPILTVKDGIVDVFERPRTMRTARDRLVALIDQGVVRGLERIAFQYTGNRSETEALRREFSTRTGIPSLLTPIGPGVGCHTGPDTMGVILVDA